MKKSIQFNIIFVILFLLIQTISFGGPWPQPKGKGYFKLSEWWLVFDQHYTDSGQIDPNVTTGIFNTSLYGEYGFTNRLTGTLYFPFLSRNYMNNLVSGTTGDILVEGEALNSVGDTDIGLKYGVTKSDSKIPLSVSLVLGLPIGKTGAGTLNNLQTGDGEFNQMIQVDIGTGFSLGNIDAYASAFTAFNNRTNDFSDEFRFGVEGGLGLLDKRFWLIGRLFGVESLKNGGTAETVTSTSIFANNTEFTSFSLEIAAYITQQWGVSANIASAFRGEVIAASPSYSFGVFLDLK